MKKQNLKLMETTSIIILSVIFGISQKLADAVNEHGTNLFQGANIFFGLIFGFSGVILSIISKDFSLFFIGLVIYWLLSNKLDFFNHRLSASLILLGILFNSDIHKNDLIHVLVVIGSFSLLKGLKKLFKNSSKITTIIFNGRIQHIFLAVVIGFWFNNLNLGLSIFFTMLSIIFTIKILRAKNNYFEIV